MIRRRVCFRMFSADLLLSEDQVALRAKCIEFASKNIKPFANDIDRTNHADLNSKFEALGEMGMLGVTVPKEYGGSNLGYLDHCVITEEISRASGAVGLSYIAHSNLCMNQINLNANEEQKKKYLPKLCSGEHIGALAMSENRSGSDVVSMRLKADRVDGGFLLNGSKLWITNGPIADTCVVYARTERSARTKGITTFIVEKSFKGFKSSKKMNKFGMRGSPTSELYFEDCFVPNENVLGKLNGGLYVLMKGLNYERLMLASGCVGIMQAVQDEVYPFSTQRSQFGRPIGDFQLIQQKIADIFAKTNSSRAYTYIEAMTADKGNTSNKDYAAVYLYAAENATQAALSGMQILGGVGYTNDVAVGRILRDAKLYEIGGGTTEIRRQIIGKDLVLSYGD